MNLSEFKKSAKKQISKLESDRVNHARDYEIEGVGVIKLAPPLPKDVYNIVINHTGNVEVQTLGDMGKDSTAELFRVIIKACAIEPEFDDEAIDILIELLGLRINDVIAVCFEMINDETLTQNKIDDVENFTNETDGPMSEPEQQ